MLKRLGATPLGRPRLIAAKIGSVIAVELVQFAVLIPVAYRARLGPAVAELAARRRSASSSAPMAFAGIGLTLAGRLPGEINLAAQNGLYLVLLLLGGMVIPFAKLPGPIRAVAHALPSGALADVLREALSGAGTQPGRSWIVLAIWAVVDAAARGAPVPLGLEPGSRRGPCWPALPAVMPERSATGHVERKVGADVLTGRRPPAPAPPTTIRDAGVGSRRTPMTVSVVATAA